MSLNPKLFTSNFSDTSSPGLLQPSYWNRVSGLLTALLDTAGATGALLMRDSASANGATWLEPSAGVLASAGAGQVPTFRALEAGDIPTIAYDSLSGLPTFGPLAFTPTSAGADGSVLFGGSVPAFRAMVAADIPQLAYSSLSGLPTLGPLAPLATGAAGTVLVGGVTPSWTATPTLTGLTISSLGPPSDINGNVFHFVPQLNTSGDLARKNIILRWDSVDGSGSAHKPFCMNATGYANLGAEDNEVFEMGWNVQNGGGLLNGAKTGARDAWESYYEPGVAGTGLWERHISAIPLDFATKGEIRMVSISGFANVNRDAMHPTITFQAEYISLTHPSTAGGAYGDSFRASVDGTNFGTAFVFNNCFSYFRRGNGPAKRGYPFLFQANAANNADLSVLTFGTSFAGGQGTNALDDELHLLIPPFPTAAMVHVGLGGQQSRFVVDGRNVQDGHALLLFREEQANGNKDAFIAVDGTSMIIGGPQTRLANYLDATIAAGAHLTLTSALATFSGGIKHGSATLLQTSVALTNGAGAGTGTLANAPASGNPTKWIPINDNGTTRYIPAW